ncbi:MAG: hypothetical protein JSS99_02660 [Actinobacteria bacterium]|nr:hypothetical protein [Actinomycetota bacterium]
MRLIRGRSSSLSLVAALAAVIVLVAASPAFAAFSVSSVTATPSTTQAGGHPDLTVAVNFGGDDTQIGGPGPANPVADSPSTYTVHLGPGLFGNPLAAPTCTLADFKADRCPVTTIVGSGAQTFVAVLAPGSPTIQLPSVIYNLATTSPDQVTLLGVRTFAGNPGPITDPGFPAVPTASRVPFAVTLNSNDLGLDSTNLEPLTAVSPTLGPLRITQLVSRLFGTSLVGQPYMSNPTACIPVPVSASATSNAGDRASGSATPYTPTDCATLPFDAGLGLDLSTTQTDAPTQAGVTITRPSAASPRRQGDVLQATTVLPAGMTVNPSLANGLEACTDAQFAAADRTTAAGCPAASRIGTVRFVSPLFLRTFEGPVYYGTRTPTAFNRLFVDVPVPGVHLKLTGRVTLNATNGQVTTVFQDLPQLPFTAFTLTFQGGARSVLVTPQTCGPNTATADLVPYARLTDATPPDATPSASFTTSFDGAGAACAAALKPWFTTTVTNTRSGGATQYTLKFGRGDRDRRIGDVTFHLTRGLIGNLALDGLTKCSLAAAASASCPASSRIGDATAQAGSGPAPVSLPGDVFLTAPRVSGDPAGLSVLVRARIGPVDLGDVVVPVRLQLRSNGGLDATAAIPQFQEGVPISPRLTAISITRAGFMRNPTSCGHRRSSGVFGGVGGGSVTTHAALDLTDCKALGFTPKFSIKVGAKGKTHDGAHPPLTTTITQPGGQAGLTWVHVVLPNALPSNSIGLNQACSQADFTAGRCGKRAQIATAKAVSPFVKGTLRGPVYLVKRPPGEKGLPRLVVQLRGPLSIDLVGNIKIGKGDKIATTFSQLPDVPVTKFVLSFHSGRFGIIAANTDLCARKLFAPTELRGQNGKRHKIRPQIKVNGCKQTRHHKK